MIDRLDLVIPAGSSLAIVGDNGAGKNTITKLLAGLYRPDAGHVRVDGVSLADADLVAWRRRLAVVFQDFVRYPFSARDNIALGSVGTPGTGDRVAEVTRLGTFLGVEQSGHRGGGRRSPVRLACPAAGRAAAMLLTAASPQPGGPARPALRGTDPK